jgi:hypothetical protein
MPCAALASGRTYQVTPVTFVPSLLQVSVNSEEVQGSRTF